MWTEQILRELDVRDAVEQKDSQYFQAFSQLAHVKSSGNDDGIRLRQENEKLVNKLNEAATTMEKIESSRKQLAKSNTQLELKVKHLTAKVEHLGLEVNEKNKSIEIINDDNLIHQIQMNVLNEKIEKLTAENNMLVERWMKKVKEDAEKMNEIMERERK